jgi:uncharacterized protein (TIGR00251 family)
MSRAWCSIIAGTVPGVRIAVHIMPNAKKSEVIGLHDDALKIRLQALPIEGKANDALVRYIADRLDVPKTSVSITRGHSNKRKILEIRAPLSVEAVEKALLLPEC